MENHFRSMRRSKQQLSDAECRAILREEMRGTLAVNGDDGYPYAFPMNFYFDEEASALYLHCAKAGHKFDAMRRCDKVCFCLHDAGRQEAGDWKLRFKSVVIFGRIRFIDTPEETAACARKFDEKFAPAEVREARLKRDLAGVQMLTLTIEHMTGKSVLEG